MQQERAIAAGCEDADDLKAKLIGEELDVSPAISGNGRGRTIGGLVQRVEELIV